MNKPMFGLFMFCYVSVDYVTIVHYFSSGMLVQDPSKGNDVDAIFNQARQLGAVERPLDQPQEPPRSTSFTGTARLLSGGTVQTASSSQQPESVVHNIVFWSNGFTVNDGPLRRLDDPANASFLEVLS
jgi:UBX domain-containing protein 1